MPRPRSDLSGRILEVARKRFLEDGVDGASLRSIAADAGTTIGMVYYYYPTKDDLFDGVVEIAYAGILRGAEEALRAKLPPAERIGLFYQRIAAMSDEEFDIIRIILREAMVSSTRLRKLAQRAVEGHLPWVLAALAEGRSDGTFDPNMPVPVQLGTTMLLATMPQVMLRIVGRAEMQLPMPLPTPAEVATVMQGVLTQGLAPRKPVK